MNLFKLYISLAQMAGYVGLGVVIGAILSDTTTNTPYWIGGILVLAGAVTLGMSISTRSESNTKKTIEEPNQPVDKPDDNL